MTNTSLLLKRSIKSAASLANISLGFPQATAGSVNIIAYHRVVADIAKAEQDAIYGIVISSDTFRHHCEMLRRAYDVVSLETAMHFLDGKRKVARPLAVITFDDGYLDFYDQAFPILNEFGMPATVFLPTAYIGQSKPLAHDRIYWLLKLAKANSVSINHALKKIDVAPELPFVSEKSGDLLKLTDFLVYLQNDIREKVIIELENSVSNIFDGYPTEYQLLDWEMVKEMNRKGISFGSHTANHVVLPLEDRLVAKYELEASKQELESQLRKKITTLAYPNGEYNSVLETQSLEAGYKIAVTTENRINANNANLLSLGRTSLCEESTRGFMGSYSPQVANLRLGVINR